MLKLSIFDFFLRAIPESLVIILAVYTFSKTTLNYKRYFLSSIIFSIMIYIIRLLPIHEGVHTILGIIVIIVLTVNINKIDIIKSIQAVIITTILQFICEGVNVFIIQNIFQADINYVFNNSLLKNLYGIPSIIILACIIILYYNQLLKKKELSDV